MASEETIARVVGVLCDAFDRQPRPTLFDAYALALSDIDDSDLLRAAKQALRSEEYFPKPAKLRELCGRGGYAAGLDCVALVRACAASVGKYRTPIFDDPAVSNAIATVGGWVAVCELSAEEFDRFTAERIRKAFQSFAARPTLKASRLVGIAELDPRTGGEFVRVTSAGEVSALSAAEARELLGEIKAEAPRTLAAATASALAMHRKPRGA